MGITLWAAKSVLAFAMRSSPAHTHCWPVLNCAAVRSRSLPPFQRTLARARAVARFGRPLFSWCCKLLFPQTVWIHADTNCPGVYYSSALLGTPRLARSTRAKSLYSLSYKRFRASQKVNLFLFNHLWTLLTKHPGWGIPSPWARQTFRRSGLSSPFATWTRRAHPTIITVSSRLQFHG